MMLAVGDDADADDDADDGDGCDGDLRRAGEGLEGPRGDTMGDGEGEGFTVV